MLILATNVISEPMQPRPDPRVLSWWSQQRKSGELFVTTITIAEILYGIALLPNGKRRDKLMAEAEGTFAEDFAERILSFDEDAASAFAETASASRPKRHPLPHLDAHIA